MIVIANVNMRHARHTSPTTLIVSHTTGGLLANKMRAEPESDYVHLVQMDTRRAVRHVNVSGQGM